MLKSSKKQAIAHTGLPYTAQRKRASLTEYANMLSLCFEEMAGNIVQHSFKPGEKRWLDLAIVDKADCVIVRLRDNGSAFNPLAYAASHQDQNHLGIHMIRSLADMFEYKRAMGLNNLVIGFKKSAPKKENEFPAQRIQA